MDLFDGDDKRACMSVCTGVNLEALLNRAAEAGHAALTQLCVRGIVPQLLLSPHRRATESACGAVLR